MRVRIPPKAWMPVCCECYVWCEVEGSAAGRSLVQRNLTECGESEYDLETWTMRRSRPTKAIEPWKTIYIYLYIYIFIHSFIHSVFCLTTGPKPTPKRCLHIVRSRASSFKWEYPLLSLRSSSSFLRLLPRLLATYISPFMFLSITCFRRQFLRKMWLIKLAFRYIYKYYLQCKMELVVLSVSKYPHNKLLSCCFNIRWVGKTFSKF